MGVGEDSAPIENIEVASMARAYKKMGRVKTMRKKRCWEEAEDLIGLGIKAPEFILSSLRGYVRALREVKWLKNNKHNQTFILLIIDCP